VIRSEVVAQALGHDNFYRAKLLTVYTVGRLPIVAELTRFESKNYVATLQRTEHYSVGSQPTSRSL